MKIDRDDRAQTDGSKEGYHHGDLRRALLDATLSLVEQHGPQGFTLRAAARAAGVSAGAPYHHFKDKDALLAAVAEEGFELFGTALRDAALMPAPSLRLRAQNVGVAYVTFAVEHPTRFRVMVGYGVQAQKQHQRLASAVKDAYRHVRAVLVAGLGAEGARDDVSEAEILGWWSVVHGLAFLAIDGHLGRRGARERVEAMVREVIVALDGRARSEQKRRPSKG